jgi:hypothetical protein
MQITIYLNRFDLLKFNLLLFWRLKSSLIYVAIVASATTAFILMGNGPNSVKQVALAVAAGLIVGIIALAIAFAACLPFILLTSNQQSGVLGEHTYTLTENGLHERTPVGDSLQKWIGIKSVKKVNGFILLQINGYLFHIIPRRAFTTDEAFEAFFRAAQSHAKAERKQTA